MRCQGRVQTLGDHDSTMTIRIAGEVGLGDSEDHCTTDPQGEDESIPLHPDSSPICGQTRSPADHRYAFHALHFENR